jgi:hypothetical protein
MTPRFTLEITKQIADAEHSDRLAIANLLHVAANGIGGLTQTQGDLKHDQKVVGRWSYDPKAT